MARIHLFEFEDQKWFPDFLRNYMTDFLQFLSNKTQLFKPVLPVLESGLKRSGTVHLVDLASGGGGGLVWLNAELKKNIPELRITLTDYFPNIPAFEFTQQQADNIDYVDQPVDARNVPEALKGFRTQFLSLHHFMPADAQRILQNAVDSNSPIGIFEAQERSIPSIIAMLLSPLSVLLTTPFIRPFKMGRLVFTYLIPVVPLCVWWDGVVSALRTYSVKEMKELVNHVKKKENFNWEINRTKSKPARILYLMGTPKKNPTD